MTDKTLLGLYFISFATLGLSLFLKAFSVITVIPIIVMVITGLSAYTTSYKMIPVKLLPFIFFIILGLLWILYLNITSDYCGESCFFIGLYLVFLAVGAVVFGLVFSLVAFLTRKLT